MTTYLNNAKLQNGTKVIWTVGETSDENLVGVIQTEVTAQDYHDYLLSLDLIPVCVAVLMKQYQIGERVYSVLFPKNQIDSHSTVTILLPASKLQVLNCKNYSDQGKFIGDLCASCYLFVAEGKGTNSQAYRNAVAAENSENTSRKELTKKHLREIWSLS